MTGPAEAEGNLSQPLQLPGQLLALDTSPTLPTVPCLHLCVTTFTQQCFKDTSHVGLGTISFTNMTSFQLVTKTLFPSKVTF